MLAYFANSQDTGVFGSYFVVDPSGTILERWNVVPRADTPTVGGPQSAGLNPYLWEQRVYHLGESTHRADFMRLVKGDEICLNAYRHTFNTPGTYTIFWINRGKYFEGSGRIAEATRAYELADALPTDSQQARAGLTRLRGR